MLTKILAKKSGQRKLHTGDKAALKNTVRKVFQGNSNRIVLLTVDKCNKLISKTVNN